MLIALNGNANKVLLIDQLRFDNGWKDNYQGYNLCLSMRLI